MDGLSTIDGLTLLAILTKASGYGAALLAMGGALFSFVFFTAPADLRRFTHGIAVAAALMMVVLLAVQFGIRAARISGMGLAGMLDSMMLGFVWQSPLGTAALWRVAGAVLIMGLFFGGRLGSSLGILGAVLIAISYTSVGHSLGEPRMFLAVLLGVHLLTVAFWVGALAPLHRVAAHSSNALLLEQFGRVASVAVPILVLAGGTFAFLMSGTLSRLTETAYGWGLFAKVVIVCGLLALAALNKLRLVPALVAGQSSASAALRRSIRMEAVAVLLILLATAALTTVTTPPVRL